MLDCKCECHDEDTPADMAAANIHCAKCHAETMQPKAEHKCDACGGSGKIGCEDHATYHKHGSTYYHRFACDVLKCPVCLGSGRISDRMPVSDAVADADTLWWGVLYQAYQAPALETATLGCQVAVWIHHNESESYRLTRLAAHAAFRAVPGLREENR